MKKRILGVLMTLVMVIGLMPVTAFAGGTGTGDFVISATDGEAELEEGEDYSYSDGIITVKTTTPVTIGMNEGVERTSHMIKVDVTEGDATVTLDDIVIEAESSTAPIYVTGTANEDSLCTFVLDGTNSVSNKSTTKSSIETSYASITFKGEGELNISDSKFGIYANYCDGTNFTITDGAKITMENLSSHALYNKGDGSVTISGNANVNVKDCKGYIIYGTGINIYGNAKVTGNSSSGYAVQAKTDTDLNIKENATIDISGKQGLSATNMTFSDKAQVKVTSEKYAVNATSTLTIKDSAKATVESKGYGFNGSKATVNINDKAEMAITIKEGSNEAIYSDALNVTDDAKIDIVLGEDAKYGAKITATTISDRAEMTITGGTCGFDKSTRASIDVKDSAKLKITEVKDYGLYYKGTLNISDKAEILISSTGEASLAMRDKVIYSIAPATGIRYKVETGADASSVTAVYYAVETTDLSSGEAKYFHAVPDVMITDVILDTTAAELKVNETTTLTATVVPDDATDKTITWTSSDPSVATVENGVVTAVGAGTAIITAQAGDVTAECEVTVTAPASDDTDKPSEDDDTTPSKSSSKKSKRYDVDIEKDDVENGSISVNTSRAKKGSTVTITVEPDEGYELDELIITDKDGDEIEWKDKGNGKYSFTMPRGDVEIEASFREIEEVKEDAPAAADEEEKEIILTIDSTIYQQNGEYLVNDVAPVIKDSSTMLPIRLVAEFLGADVAWNEAEQSVTITKGDTTIIIYIGQAFALVNGEPVELDAPAFIANDRTYLPVRFVAENLGAEVIWNEADRTVTIRSAE